MMKKIYLLSAIVISIGLLGCKNSPPAEPKPAQASVNRSQTAIQNDIPVTRQTAADEQKALQETAQKDTEDTSHSHQTAGPGITYEEYQKLSQIEREPNDINSNSILSAEQIREMLKGMVFASEGEWRMGPNQEYRGRWGLAFMKDRPEFKWLDYDVEREYGYSVLDDKKIITYEYGKTIEIPYDSNLSRIQWQGMWYRRVSPDSNGLSAEQIRQMLKGMRFESEELREGGRKPDGEISEYRSLSFMKDKQIFKWLNDGTERGYSYSVSEDRRIIASVYGQTIEIPYDSNFTQIQWQGMWYRRVDPDGNCLSAEQIRTMLNGMTFESEELRERGLGPDGPVIGRWGFFFKENMFEWLHSDMAEAYKYSVSEEGRIIIAGKYVPHDCNLSRILWQGMWYRRVNPDSNNGQ